MPVAMISTSTSPALGPSRSSSTISSGCLASKATAARVFMGRFPPDGQRRARLSPGQAPRVACHFFGHGPSREKEGSAGIGDSAPFQRTARESWDRIIATNLTSLFDGAQLALPDLLDGEDKRLVIV